MIITKNKIKEIYIISFLFFLNICSFCESNSNFIEAGSKSQELLNQVIERLSSLKEISFQCQYHVLSIYFKEDRENEIKRIGEFNGAFKYQKGNFYREAYIYIPPEIPREISLDNAKNLLEILVKKLYGRFYDSLNSYDIWCSYCYNETICTRIITKDRTGRIEVFKGSGDGYDDMATYPDPRCLIGFFGRDLYDSESTQNPIHIVDYLNMPGKTMYYEKDGYKILWHYVEKEPIGSAGLSYQPGIEVWVNSKGDVEKIIEAYFLTRIFGEERIKQILNGLDFQINFDFPADIEKVYEWSNFEDIDIGKEKIYIPQKCKITDYFYQKGGPSAHNLCQQKYYEYYTQGKKLESFVTRWACVHIIPLWEKTIEIKRNTFIANISIPDEEFIPPTPTISTSDDSDEGKTFLKKYNISLETIIFILGYVIFTLIAMFITRRYFGWGL